MFNLSLDTLLSYKNDKVTSRYDRDYPHSNLSSEEAFVEFLKYVWLCHQHMVDKKNHPADDKFNFACVIHSEMKDIDNMWHTFLLFTKDYHSFCNNYLNGVFFHHEPVSLEEPVLVETSQNDLERYLSYIYDKLGESTLIKWFNAESFQTE